MKLKELLELLSKNSIVEIYEVDEKKEKTAGYEVSHKEETFIGYAFDNNGSFTPKGEYFGENEILSIKTRIEETYNKHNDWDDFETIFEVQVQKIPFNEKEWIHRMMYEYFEDPSSVVYRDYNGGITFMLNFENPQANYGWSKCNMKKDKYSQEKGLAIAWARYKNYKIPEEL